ncbi:hypothetical protein E2C01_045896 [Portunus trituberculatus]|uniref:Uncharacterized protein n=1 Tax=Portunus trituberculatus TaxID=210409 RepID=A0A5B7G2L7_PORTR|nr:hypothetical protein [Portunus trituberculatus]
MTLDDTPRDGKPWRSGAAKVLLAGHAHCLPAPDSDLGPRGSRCVATTLITFHDAAPPPLLPPTQPLSITLQ